MVSPFGLFITAKEEEIISFLLPIGGTYLGGPSIVPVHHSLPVSSKLKYLADFTILAFMACDPLNSLCER